MTDLLSIDLVLAFEFFILGLFTGIMILSDIMEWIEGPNVNH